jgi:hypothetical protein
MTNEDVIDLYGRVKIGTIVVVLARGLMAHASKLQEVVDETSALGQKRKADIDMVIRSPRLRWASNVA